MAIIGVLKRNTCHIEECNANPYKSTRWQDQQLENIAKDKGKTEGFNPGSDDAPIPFPKPRQGRRVIRTSIIKTVTTSIPLRKIHRPAGACWVWITPFPGVKTPVCIPASHARLKRKRGVGTPYRNPYRFRTRPSITIERNLKPSSL